ncbi:MAG: hypothetical protein BHV84_05510 [Prevotella sp. AG:487_50_53]|nr:MAG: hypothetical protein BHV84_05510 [Prevotella sp. AG:487_50_53]
MDNVSISIIIPLYNAELYINQCLLSIKNQTFTNWEAIIIDDGSSDESYNVCNKLIKDDKRFRLIKKINEGVSITRNKALDLCNGDYIFFLDADDYLLDKDCLSKLTELIEVNDLDYIRFEYKAVDIKDTFLFNNSNKYLRRKYYNKVITPCEYCDNVAHDEFFLCFSFFKAYIIKRYKIRFLEGCRMREDADFIIRYLFYCKNVLYIPDEFYAYRKHDNAATFCNARKYDEDLKMVFDSLFSFCSECKDIEYRNYIYKFLSLFVIEQKKSKYISYYRNIINGFPVKDKLYRISNLGKIGSIYIHYYSKIIRTIMIFINLIRIKR